MNTAIWTMWLVTFATGQGTATPVVTPLATYQSDSDCHIAVENVATGLRKEYGKSAPMPGLMFCVYGTPIRKQ